ncbi:MAG TPA: universal stress protein [Bacteroidia bacterium]|nr:universal stress protein [Bacteroidia bacterium]
MKLNIRKILVPIDFSETGLLAMEHAAFLARLVKAEITLLHVIPLTEYYFRLPEPIMYIETAEEMRQMIENKLTETAKEMRKEYSISVRTLATRGKVAAEVVEIAREEKSDLIIMGTHGAKGFEEYFIGSNAERVVSLAPCPVVTVQTHATHLGFTNIVLPIDRLPHSREKVEPAIQLASVYNAKIHILGLLEEEGEGEYEKLQIVLNQVQTRVEHAGLTFTRHTLKGTNLAVESLKYANSVAADLIIIMTDQESKLTGILLGVIARQIVNHSRVPVMSIKPHYHEFASIDLTGAYHY